ncbi:hypothetical protein AV530_007511 [Patagioenas fasciata monilis]|uniref:Uncharacterized protein n=1 Tax=Patagioenas fasciata monilis TaxID=372326 RepID=A0A1V4JY06_PATFA|nr:hypothetical protein AV530_007511 [Patagioenas fasciata monilis]
MFADLGSAERLQWCRTWICSPSCKNVTTQNASTEDQNEGCQKLPHLEPFSILISEAQASLSCLPQQTALSTARREIPPHKR